ncbi:MAG TPA: hypothetical protein VGH27_11330 [Streptosporangiaceae bacterium]|jgi:hypothetical protein
MAITSADTTRVALEQDAADAARHMLGALTLSAVAPESYPGKLRAQDRLAELARDICQRARDEAVPIARAARVDLDELRRSELAANPFGVVCLRRAAQQIRELPGPLGAADVQAVIASLISKELEKACLDVNLDSARTFKTRKGVDRRRRQLKAEIDVFVRRLQLELAQHIAGHARDELADELGRRAEAAVRTSEALRRLVREAKDPGEEIPGAHRFSCGPRTEVVLKAAAVKRPDLLDRNGRPTEAIWPAFGAEVAAGDLAVMENPQDAINTLSRFLESIVTGALAGVTLDGLYSLSQQQPEVPNWIAKAAARLPLGPRARQLYQVRLAQVPATGSDILHNHVGRHIQSAIRSTEPNRLQIVELSYAFTADEVLEADPRGLIRILDDVLPRASNPRLAAALKQQRDNLTSHAPQEPGNRRPHSVHPDNPSEAA